MCWDTIRIILIAHIRNADGDFKITESMVVVDYLDAKFGKGNGLTPSDPQQAAEVCCRSPESPRG